MKGDVCGRDERTLDVESENQNPRGSSGPWGEGKPLVLWLASGSSANKVAITLLSHDGSEGPCELAGAATAKYHQLGDLKQRDFPKMHPEDSASRCPSCLSQLLAQCSHLSLHLHMSSPLPKRTPVTG